MTKTQQLEKMLDDFFPKSYRHFLNIESFLRRDVYGRFYYSWTINCSSRQRRFGLCFGSEFQELYGYLTNSPEYLLNYFFGTEWEKEIHTAISE